MQKGLMSLGQQVVPIATMMLENPVKASKQTIPEMGLREDEDSRLLTSLAGAARTSLQV
jgi:hypothetical protein